MTLNQARALKKGQRVLARGSIGSFDSISTKTYYNPTAGKKEPLVGIRFGGYSGIFQYWAHGVEKVNDQESSIGT